MNQAELEIIKGLISIVKCHNGKFSDLDIKILKGVYKIVNALEEPERWITVKGNHIPIFKGQTPQEAIEKFYQRQNRTIAGVKRGKSMSLIQANSNRVNPNYNLSKIYHNNCQSCVAVFEARIRGYDLEVLPRTFSTERIMKKLSKEPYLAYIDPNTGEHPKFERSKVSNPQDCYNWLRKNIKQGERYAFGFSFKGNKDRGHIVEVFININNELIFYDPQASRQYNYKYLNYLEYQADNVDYSPQIFRLDDKELNYEILNKISRPIRK